MGQKFLHLNEKLFCILQSFLLPHCRPAKKLKQWKRHFQDQLVLDISKKAAKHKWSFLPILIINLSASLKNFNPLVFRLWKNAKTNNIVLKVKLVVLQTTMNFCFDDFIWWNRIWVLWEDITYLNSDTTLLSIKLLIGIK